MTRSMVADAAEAYARRLGEKHGRNAANWYIQDAFGGRVTRGARESAARILDGLGEGDPEIMDAIPHADLSGLWAGSLTGEQLVADAFADAGGDQDRHARLWAWLEENCFTEICDMYEQAFDGACQYRIAHAARMAS